VLLPDPTALVGWAEHDDLLVLEQPWERVLASLPPPLYRHRYGT
jgi:hypothetical protein